MTSLTMRGLWTTPTLRYATLVRQLVLWTDVINGAAAVLRPLAVSVGVITAAATWSAPAHADPTGDSVGDNGPISSTIAGIGQSICPMLVQPGATFASVASQLAGNTGMSPAIAGFVTSMAIQMECPGIMTSLANGNVPFPLQVPGANPGPPFPLQVPGANPGPPFPLQAAGAGPAPPTPFQLPNF